MLSGGEVSLAVAGLRSVLGCREEERWAGAGNGLERRPVETETAEDEREEVLDCRGCCWPYRSQSQCSCGTQAVVMQRKRRVTEWQVKMNRLHAMGLDENHTHS